MSNSAQLSRRKAWIIYGATVIACYGLTMIPAFLPPYEADVEFLHLLLIVPWFALNGYGVFIGATLAGFGWGDPDVIFGIMGPLSMPLSLLPVYVIARARSTRGALAAVALWVVVLLVGFGAYLIGYGRYAP